MPEDLQKLPQKLPPKDPDQTAVRETAGNVASLAEARAAARHTKPKSSLAPQADDADEGHNPLAVALGAAVILGLLIGTWLLVDSMKCNPMFSDAGLSHSRACR